MTLILTLISFAIAEEPTTQQDTEQQITFIDFEEVELTGEMVKPNLVLVGSRQPAKITSEDLLIIDVRQLFIDKQGQQTK